MLFQFLLLVASLPGFSLFSGLESISDGPCDEVPALNKSIVDYVTTRLNKKVGKGECWDLAAEALNTNHAKWDGRYKYGTPVDPKSDCIYPGDIIQFERVTIEQRNANGFFIEEMPHHTAIVYEVLDNGHYKIAHQNYGNMRKVVITPLRLENIKKGKVMIYRPQRP